MVFDAEAMIVTGIQREDGRKQIEVRWPTDEEWLERMKGWSIRVQKLGRGQTISEIESGAADLALYNKIRTEESPDLSQVEAQKLIGSLSSCEINDVELGLDEATVRLTILRGKQVTHTLRIPTTAEIAQYQRTARKLNVDLPHGGQKIRLPVQAAADLWEKCHRGHEGYQNGVPVIHRDVGIRAVIAECEREAEAPEDEDF